MDEMNLSPLQSLMTEIIAGYPFSVGTALDRDWYRSLEQLGFNPSQSQTLLFANKFFTRADP